MEAVIGLAAAAVSVLAPALRQLLRKGGESAAGEVGARLGAEGWDQAKKLWTKVGPRIEGSPSALATAQKLAASPDDEDLKAALRVHMREILAEDSNLRGEVTQIIGSTIQSGDTNIMTRGSVIDSTIIGHIETTTTAAEGAQRLPKNPIARALWLLGFVVALTGFGIAFLSIVMFMFGPELEGPGPDTGSVLIGVPVGFGVFFLGFVLVAVGSVLGELTKKRDE